MKYYVFYGKNESSEDVLKLERVKHVILCDITDLLPLCVKFGADIKALH